MSRFEWKRHRRAVDAHAYRKTDLASAQPRDMVEPIAFCETYPAEDIIRDDDAAKCLPCKNLVERAEGTL